MARTVAVLSTRTSQPKFQSVPRQNCANIGGNTENVKMSLARLHYTLMNYIHLDFSPLRRRERRKNGDVPKVKATPARFIVHCWQ